MNNSNIKRNLVGFGAMLFFSVATVAQGQEAKPNASLIDVDPLTKRAAATIPFDQPFVLKLEYPEEPYAVEYLVDHKNRSWQCMVLNKQTFVLPRLPKEHVAFKKEGEKTFLYLRFDYDWNAKGGKQNCGSNNLIGPSQNLAVLFTSFDPQGFDILSKVHHGKLVEAKATLDALFRERIDNHGVIFGLASQDSLPKLHELVKSNYDRIDSLESLLQSHLATMYSLQSDSCFRQLASFALTDSTAASSRCPLDCSILRDMLTLRSLDSIALTAVLSGARTISDSATKKTEEERLVNLKTTNEQFKSIVLLRGRMDLLSATCSDTVFQKIQEAAGRSHTLLNAIVKERTAIRKRMMDHPYDSFRALSSVEASSTILEFKTRSAFRIIPDFGFIYYGFQKNFNGALPYLGIAMNIRQMNKAIPFGVYPNRRLGHYLSLSLGWTLNSISEEGKRNDLFTKGSLMTGLGVRINHSLRVNAGGLWFYKNDENPVIDERTLTVTPYVGLSLDLDLKQWLNGLDGLIPFAP